MSDLALQTLENRWSKNLEEKNWKMLGKLLRSFSNVLKSSESHTEYETILAERVEFLEKNYEEMPDNAVNQVIGDLRHVKRHTKLRQTGQFGAALKQRIPAGERRKIQRKNRPPKLNPRYEQRYGALPATGDDTDDFQSNGVGVSDSEF